MSNSIGTDPFWPLIEATILRVADDGPKLGLKQATPDRRFGESFLCSRRAGRAIYNLRFFCGVRV